MTGWDRRGQGRRQEGFHGRVGWIGRKLANIDRTEHSATWRPAGPAGKLNSYGTITQFEDATFEIVIDIYYTFLKCYMPNNQLINKTKRQMNRWWKWFLAVALVHPGHLFGYKPLWASVFFTTCHWILSIPPDWKLSSKAQIIVTKIFTFLSLQSLPFSETL